MSALDSIVNTYKAKTGMKRDHEVANRLHVKPAAFSNYLNGRSQLPQILIARLAEESGIDPMKVMAAVNLTYEKTPVEERPFWQEKLGALHDLAKV
jgi:plasmid maintenance system antidote protein VapI